MTEDQLAAIERLLSVPVQDSGVFAGNVMQVIMLVPDLISEVRKLRAMLGVQSVCGPVTFPPESNERNVELATADEVQAVLGDIGKMLGECCVEGTGFVLALFDTREDYEPLYAFNAEPNETVKALRRVTELVEQS